MGFVMDPFYSVLTVKLQRPELMYKDEQIKHLIGKCEVVELWTLQPCFSNIFRKKIHDTVTCLDNSNRRVSVHNMCNKENV